MENLLYVLYQNSGVHSGRALRTMLTGLHKGEVRGGFPSRFEKFLKKNTPQFVINLGTTGEISFEGTILNPREMVRSASNKRQARITFREAEVPAPQLFLRGRDVKENDLPVIGRTSYHNKGKGFWFCKTPQQVRQAGEAGATHFLKYIPKTREYRVHTFCKTRAFGKSSRKDGDYISIKMAEKVWQGEKAPDPRTVQKNYEFGWVFLGPQNRREEELDVVRFAAKQAVAALGLDFGAVDVMYRIGTKTPYVLEVNSTPSLADDTADTCEVYAKRILRVLGISNKKKDTEKE